tara:strand:- start:6801 stop:8909 length:2109 start_codon:yes stop_codon:yes gene_type:complete
MNNNIVLTGIKKTIKVKVNRNDNKNSSSNTKIYKDMKKTIKKNSDNNEKNDEEKKPKSQKGITTKKLIENFRKQGSTVFDNLTEKRLQKLLKDARLSYYNDEPLITDNEYDIVKEYMEKKYPTNEETSIIGANVKSDKVKLPYFMGSMDKIKPDTNAIERWKLKYKGPYVISAKLDGVSGLYSTENGDIKLYTRGNGKIGQDISKFIPYMNLPVIKNDNNENIDIVVRGEFIMKRSNFENNYIDKFSNSRNLISGIINSKNIDLNKTKHMDFVVYEVIKPEIKPSEQMEFLKENGFKYVRNEIAIDVNNKYLSDILVLWRNEYEYEIDGIICMDDNIYPRIDGNPDYAFAFKMILGEQISEAKVLMVHWSPSKDGILKPRIEIEPIVLNGVNIKYATAFNAAFVLKNKLGFGAKIKILRSGDVIPYILDVIEPAQEAMMPNDEYEWYGDTNIDIILKNKDNNTDVLSKNILFFFRGLNVDGIGPGNVDKIIAAGYNSIPKIVSMSKNDLMKVEGFKDRMINKIYDNIRKVLNESKLIDIMAASNTFGHGMGKKKMELIMEEYDDILISDETNDTKIDKIKNIKGMAKKSAELFVKHIDDFKQFIEDIGHKDKLYKKVSGHIIDKENPLYKKSIILTGFRDEKLSKYLTDVLGVKITSAVSKGTFIVIVKDDNEKTGKIDNAIKIGIPIINVEKFKSTYNIPT